MSGVTAQGFWLSKGSWIHDVFIPRSVIIDCDADLDEVDFGMEVTVEIPGWLAEREGLAE